MKHPFPILVIFAHCHEIEIIDITTVIFETKLFKYHIKPVQEEICIMLTWEIAYRQTLSIPIGEKRLVLW